MQQAQHKLPIVLVLGPTASGKTDLAIALAQHFPVHLISVDSALVYQEMNIGTAKPDAATLAAYPHALVNHLLPTEAYSAAQFCQDAQREIQLAHAAQKIPVLVGGTMLYYKALIEGLSDLPSSQPEIRAQLEAQLAEQGLRALYADLQQFDPFTAARLQPSDSQRIQRALELWHMTGQPMSTLLANSPPIGIDYPCLTLALMPTDRSILHTRIGKRFENMLAQGFIEEVQQLRQDYALSADSTSMRCVGYRQVWQYLSQQLSYAEMQERGIIATRQLCKRQLTWMRAMEKIPNYGHWQILNCDQASSVLNNTAQQAVSQLLARS